MILQNKINDRTAYSALAVFLIDSFYEDRIYLITHKWELVIVPSWILFIGGKFQVLSSIREV